jgi:hypothetical protein
MMTRIQAQKAHDLILSKALETINKLGGTYTVKDQFGKAHTNVKTTRKKVNDFSPLNITPKIREATPGDVIVFDAENFPLNRLQSTITAKANKVCGSGNYISEQDPQKNQVRLTVTGNVRQDELEQVVQALGGAA